METNDLYPPTPAGARPGSPATLTYRLRVAFVLLSLALFLALYLGLVAASGYATWWLVWAGPHTGWIGVMLGLGTAMLFVFLVKGLFRGARLGADGFVRITEEEQPKLFAFVRRLCADAKSPFPAAIYVSHDVNAAVFYRRSVLSLFLPQRKRLLIGLGLVNALNLSEFKAVLAHEFGHFAQNSLKLGQYVYVANQVLHDLVVSRDAWDEWLAKWRSIDLRVSFPAWILTGVVWGLRKLLALLFKLVNFANLSLSRQMEFDADRHAVALTGSDALVSGLWKTERAGLAMEGAWATLSSVVGYRKWSSDVFFHQRAQLDRLDEMLARETEVTPFLRALREPYRYGAALHFQAGDNHAPSMWATHPSNRDREVNAKREYVAVPPVERSAWELFDQKKSLKKKLTLMAYQMRLGHAIRPDQCLPAKEIEALVREDQEEQKQAPHYHGLYESRFIDPGDVDALAREVDALDADDADALREGAAAWAGERLAAFMADLKREEEEAEVLEAAAEQPDKPFTLRGATYDGGKVGRMREASKKRLAPLRERLSGADAAIFKHVYARTKDDPDARAELLTRYRFLRAVEQHIHALIGAENIFGQVLRMLEAGNQLTPEQFRQVKGGFGEVHARIDRVLDQTRKLRVPKLSHLEENTRVRAYILGEDLVDPIAGDRIEGRFIGELGRQLNVVLSRLRRLHFKNLGALLRLQERLDPDLHGIPAPPPADAD